MRVIRAPAVSAEYRILDSYALPSGCKVVIFEGEEGSFYWVDEPHVESERLRRAYEEVMRRLQYYSKPLPAHYDLESFVDALLAEAASSRRLRLGGEERRIVRYYVLRDLRYGILQPLLEDENVYKVAAERDRVYAYHRAYGRLATNVGEGELPYGELLDRLYSRLYTVHGSNTFRTREGYVVVMSYDRASSRVNHIIVHKHYRSRVLVPEKLRTYLSILLLAKIPVFIVGENAYPMLREAASLLPRGSHVLLVEGVPVEVETRDGDIVLHRYSPGEVNEDVVSVESPDYLLAAPIDRRILRMAWRGVVAADERLDHREAAILAGEARLPTPYSIVVTRHSRVEYVFEVDAPDRPRLVYEPGREEELRERSVCLARAGERLKVYGIDVGELL